MPGDIDFSSLAGVTLNRLFGSKNAKGEWIAGHNQDFIVWFCAVVALNVVARGQALFSPLYSPDSYALLGEKPGDELINILSDGRFVSIALYWLQSALGFPAVRSVSTQMCAAILIFAASGFIFAKTIFNDIRPKEAFAFSAMFTLNPLAAEFFYYSETTLRTSQSVFLAATAVWAAFHHRATSRSYVLAIVSTFLALGVYQLAIAHIAIATVFMFFLKHKEKSLESERTSNSSNINVAMGTASLIVGVALYLCFLFATKLIFPEIASGRAFATEMPSVIQRVGFASRVVLAALLPPVSLAPTFISQMTVFGVLACAWLSVKSFFEKRAPIAGAVGLFLILAALASSESIFLLAGNLWPTARLMSPIGLFLAFLALFAYRESSDKLRVFEAIGLSILIVGYLGANSTIFFEQRRINKWDERQANRIVARLESEPAFESVTSLASIGSQWRYPYSRDAAYGGLNVSAFRPSWAQVGLIEEATGYRFSKPSTEATALAIRYCEKSRQWPAPDSVTIIDKLAIVCLPNETGP
jgi:Glucosyl transferase GtrII